MIHLSSPLPATVKSLSEVLVPVSSPTPKPGTLTPHYLQHWMLSGFFIFVSFLIVKWYISDVIICIFLMTSKILPFSYVLHIFGFHLRIDYAYFLLGSFSEYSWSSLFVAIICIFQTLILCHLPSLLSQWPTFLPSMVNKSVYLSFNVESLEQIRSWRVRTWTSFIQWCTPST